MSRWMRLHGWFQIWPAMCLRRGTNAARRHTHASLSLFICVVNRSTTSSTSSYPAVSSPFSPPLRSYFSLAAPNDLDSVGTTGYHAIDQRFPVQCFLRYIIHRVDNISPPKFVNILVQVVGLWQFNNNRPDWSRGVTWPRLLSGDWSTLAYRPRPLPRRLCESWFLSLRKHFPALCDVTVNRRLTRWLITTVAAESG